MQKYLMIVVGDWNDADYVHSIVEVKESYKDRVMNWLDKHNLKDSIDVTALLEQFEEEESGEDLDFLYDLCPSAPDPHNVHTIDSIIFYKVSEAITAI